ncbi:hypothetical protein LRP88_02077 [Fusarium phalaenopsidis]
MKLTVATALAALAPSVYGHYFFDKLVIDGRETGSNQYIRASTRPTKYNPIKWENVRDNSTPNLDDIICNQGAFTNAGNTETAEIQAGTKVGFKLAVGATMQHPGPGLAYLSKAPTTAQTYKGDGEWFKVYETGVCDTGLDFTSTAWCTWDKNLIEFNIPEDTPNGEYLLRVEHIGVHGAHVGQAEFYPACAQVKIIGGGSGSSPPGPTVKFPGAYKKTDPSFNFSIYGGYKTYPMPGPAVWNGGSSNSSSDSTGSGSGSTGSGSGSTGSGSGSKTCAAKYAQCGGQNFSGAKCCKSGSICKSYNSYFSMCV